MTSNELQLYEIHHKTMTFAIEQHKFVALHSVHYAVGLLSTFYLGQSNQTETFLFLQWVFCFTLLN